MNPDPIRYVPTPSDYPQLKKWIFSETWDFAAWKNVTDLGHVSGNFREIRLHSSTIWRYDMYWKPLEGVKYSASARASQKVTARKQAARIFLAKLHENGVLAEISENVVQLKQRAENLKKHEKEIRSQCSTSRVDAYNYAASILAVPQVKVFPKYTPTASKSKPIEYVFTIELQECNILVEATGIYQGLVEAEAITKFKNAIDEYQNTNNDSGTLNKNAVPLTVEQGKEFVFYFKRKSQGLNNITVDINQKPLPSHKYQPDKSLISGQVIADGKEIGQIVYSTKSKEAESLAYLTAAVELANKDPSVLKSFFNETRSSSGEIVNPTIQVPLLISHDTLQLVKSASNLINRESIFTKTSSTASLGLDRVFHRRRLRYDMSLDEIRSRNRLLKTRHEAFQSNPLFRQLREQKASLPMNQYREQVIRLIDENTFCVIVGETGSGKTTQVPAIVFEDAIIKGRATSVNIMCTQPRRIAAKSVATRVAFERGENLQETVGYHVYLDVKRPKLDGNITYCTTEILLKQLQNDPDEAMESISHIIVDEAHERDIPIDFLLITLKKIIQARQAAQKRVPKVIIMSATLNISEFANYFGHLDKHGIMIPCPSLSVPGKTFPVKKLFLDDILMELRQSYGKVHCLENCTITKNYLTVEKNSNEHSSSMPGRMKAYDLNDKKNKQSEDALIPHNLVSTMIGHIIKTSSDGAILTFLPGLKDLEEVQKSLLKEPLGIKFNDETKFKIILLHSLMKDAQKILFESSPPGCRKIILATNIAETSITIPDVRYVVDTGKINEMNFDPVTRIKNLRCTWASKSNSRQRAGRAGRVHNGFYYALFSKNRYESLRDYGLPQLLRSDLQDVCLSAKGQKLQYPIKEFLADAVEKPSPQAVDAAIKGLVQLGALTSDEQITPLGRLLHSLPVDPDLGKMIVLGVIFQCFDPLLIIAAAESEKDFFCRPLLKRKEADRSRNIFGSDSKSDAIALINAYREARVSRKNMSRSEYMMFMLERFLNATTFETIQKKMFQIEDVLADSGVIPRSDRSDSRKFYCGHTMLNQNSDNQDLIKALTLARCSGNLAVRLGGTLRFRTKTESGIRIKTGINGSGFGRKSNLPIKALISYATMFKDENSMLCLRDTNVINPLAAILFGGTLTSKFRRISSDDWIIYDVSTDSATPQFLNPYHALMDLRAALDKVLFSSFLDLAGRKNLLYNDLRRNFTNAVAEILTMSNETSQVEDSEGESETGLANQNAASEEIRKKGYLSLDLSSTDHNQVEPKRKMRQRSSNE